MVLDRTTAALGPCTRGFNVEKTSTSGLDASLSEKHWPTNAIRNAVLGLNSVNFDFPRWILTTENIYPFGGESLRWRISLAISGHMGSSPGNCSSLCTGSTWISGGYTVMSSTSTSLSLNAGNCRCASRTRDSTSLAIPEISLVSKPAMT
ncbi:hypothetical protein BDR06DRAFT_618730 [Suillus hirtellus]|nr:hypothetical protein BDR06DRAFT_618730 [Suillus hirtellus]